jgi:uncharacterized membrane protein YGL010W
MRTLKALLQEHQREHQNHNNVMAHTIGVPAVLIGALILLSWVSISIASHWHITFSWVAVIAVLAYYYRLNVKLAAVMTIVLAVITLICIWIGYPKPTTFNVTLFIILFVGGAISLFIGHSFETSKDSFQSCLSRLLVAPLFLLIQVLTTLKLTKYVGLEDNSSQERDSH